MFNRGFGTAIGTRCVPPHAFLTLRYHEETKIYPGITKFFPSRRM